MAAVGSPKMLAYKGCSMCRRVELNLRDPRGPGELIEVDTKQATPTRICSRSSTAPACRDPARPSGLPVQLQHRRDYRDSCRTGPEPVRICVTRCRAPIVIIFSLVSGDDPRERANAETGSRPKWADCRRTVTDQALERWPGTMRLGVPPPTSTRHLRMERSDCRRAPLLS